MKNHWREMKKVHIICLISLLGFAFVLNESMPLIKAWASSGAATSARLMSSTSTTAQALAPPRNLRATASGNAVTLNWDPPEGGEMGEAQIGSQGGTVASANGAVTVIIPPGGFSDPTRVRVTPIPIQDFHNEVVARGITPVGEPLDPAAVIEIEAVIIQVSPTGQSH